MWSPTLQVYGEGRRRWVQGNGHSVGSIPWGRSIPWGQTDLEFSPQEILNRSDPEAPPRLQESSRLENRSDPEARPRGSNRSDPEAPTKSCQEPKTALFDQCARYRFPPSYPALL